MGTNEWAGHGPGRAAPWRHTRVGRLAVKTQARTPMPPVPSLQLPCGLHTYRFRPGLAGIVQPPADSQVLGQVHYATHDASPRYATPRNMELGAVRRRLLLRTLIKARPFEVIGHLATSLQRAGLVEPIPLVPETGHYNLLPKSAADAFSLNAAPLSNSSQKPAECK